MYNGFRARAFGVARHRVERTSVPGQVWIMGTVSMFTDASTEMVAATLPVFLLLRVGPLGLSRVDALQHLVTALVLIGSGSVSDRLGRRRLVALIGYAGSLVSRLVLLFGINSVSAVAGAATIDRIGKGIRTGPRDALIADKARLGHLASAYPAARRACS